MRKRALRVLVGLKEVAGYGIGLARGLAQIGVRCAYVDVFGHRFSYGGEGLNTPRLAKWLARNNQRAESFPPISRRIWRVVHVVLRLPLLLWSLARCDAFVFLFGSSFFRFRELALLKALGKKIIHVYLGSDSRPAYMNGAIVGEGTGWNPARCAAIVGETRRNVLLVERYADAIVDYPSFGHFHRRRFVNGFRMGLPTLVSDTETPPHGQEKRVVVLHAPSRPGFKGTAAIRRTMEELKKRHDIDYVEISGRPHDEAVEMIRSCDLVVDQLYSDTPMAALATEAAHLGKPSVVGGYYHAQLLRDVPADLIPPSAFCHPDGLGEQISRLVTDTAYREELGRRARAFVRGPWSAEQVARRFLRVIEGDVPPEWLFDPYAIRYVHGAGISEAQLREVVRELVRSCGIASLGLDDKPELVVRLLELAGLESQGDRRREAAPKWETVE